MGAVGNNKEEFLDISNFQKIEKIGAGGYGKVYKVLSKKDNNYYAMKKISVIDEEVQNEIKILSTIDSEYIVKYYGSFTHDKKLYIIMELCDNFDLRKLIDQYKEKKKSIPSNVILFILFDICRGLHEIHNKKLIHRDIKPENLFISKDYKIKIGDFGISRILNSSKSFANTKKGTINYMAPEMLKKEGEYYNNKVDIWALGCVIYELCTLEFCFDCDSLYGLCNKIINGQYNKIDSKIYYKEIQDLIDLLLKKDFDERPNIDIIFNLVDKYNYKYFKRNDFEEDDNYISQNFIIRQNNYFSKYKNNKNNIIIITINLEKDENIPEMIIIEQQQINTNNSLLQIFEEILLKDDYSYPLSKFILENINLSAEYRNRYSNRIGKIEYFMNSDFFFKLDSHIKILIDENEYNYNTIENFYFSKGNHIIKLEFGSTLFTCNNMFNGCKQIIHIDFSFCDTSLVTSANNMFYNCENLNEVNLSKFNNLTDFNGLFNGCINLKNVIFPKKKYKNIFNIGYMFYNCKNLEYIDLSSFDTYNTKLMCWMFLGCSNLKEIKTNDNKLKKQFNIFKKYYSNYLTS